MKNLKNIIENNLKTRTTEELKNDIKEAMNSEDEGSNIVFCLGLSVLEERLTIEDYAKFEDSL